MRSSGHTSDHVVSCVASRLHLLGLGFLVFMCSFFVLFCSCMGEIFIAIATSCIIKVVGYMSCLDVRGDWYRK